jgi:hypothetical protein
MEMSQFTEDWDKIVSDPRWAEKDAKQRRQIARRYINDNKYIYGLTGASPEVKKVLSDALGELPKQSRLSRIGEGLLAGVKYPTVGSIVTEAFGGEQDLPGPIDIAKEALRGKGDIVRKSLIAAAGGGVPPSGKKFAITEEETKKLATPNVPYARPDLTYMGSAALGMLPEQTAEMLSGMKLGSMAAEYIPGASQLRRRAVQAGAGFIAGAAFPGVAGPVAYVLTPEERKENIAEMAQKGALFGGAFGAAGGFLFPGPKAPGTQAASQAAPPLPPQPTGPTILGQQISPADIVLQPPSPPTAPPRQVRVGQPLPKEKVKPTPVDVQSGQRVVLGSRFTPAPAPAQAFPSLRQPLVTEAPQMGPLTAPEPISPMVQGRAMPRQELPAGLPAIEGRAPQVRGVTQAAEQAQDILSPQEIEQAFQFFSTARPPEPPAAPAGMMSARRMVQVDPEARIAAKTTPRGSAARPVEEPLQPPPPPQAVVPAAKTVSERLSKVKGKPQRIKPEPEAAAPPAKQVAQEAEVPVAPKAKTAPAAKEVQAAKQAAEEAELELEATAQRLGENNPETIAAGERAAQLSEQYNSLRSAAAAAKKAATAPATKPAPKATPAAEAPPAPKGKMSKGAKATEVTTPPAPAKPAAPKKKEVVRTEAARSPEAAVLPKYGRGLQEAAKNAESAAARQQANEILGLARKHDELNSAYGRSDSRTVKANQEFFTAFEKSDDSVFKAARDFEGGKMLDDSILSKTKIPPKDIDLDPRVQNRQGAENVKYDGSISIPKDDRGYAWKIDKSEDGLYRYKIQNTKVTKSGGKEYANEFGRGKTSAWFNSKEEAEKALGKELDKIWRLETVGVTPNKAARLRNAIKKNEQYISTAQKKLQDIEVKLNKPGIPDWESQALRFEGQKSLKTIEDSNRFLKVARKELGAVEAAAKGEPAPKPKPKEATKEALEAAKEVEAKEAKKGKPRPAAIRLIQEEDGFVDPVRLAQIIGSTLKLGGRGVAEVLRFATRALNSAVRGIYGGGGALIKAIAMTKPFGVVARNLSKAGDVIEKYGRATTSAIGDFAGDRLVDYASRGTSTASKRLMRRVGTILKTDSRQTAKRFKEVLRAPAKTSNGAFNAVINEIKRFMFGEFGMSKDLVDAIAAIYNETVIFLRDLQKYAGELLVKYRNDPDELVRVGRELEDRAYAGSDPEILRGKAILKNVSKALYDVGAIRKGAYELYGETGSYLPRIYLKWLKLNEDRSGLSLKLFRLVNEDPSFAGYKHRGIQELMTRKKFLEDRAKGVEWVELDKASRRYRATIARKTGKKLTDKKVLAWRDLTEAEQNKLNREWNPIPSMVQLYDTALRDLKSGKLFDYLSTGSDSSGRYAMTPDELGISVKKKSDLPKEFADSSGQRWVYLDPNAIAVGGTIKKFGNLGGNYVRSDIASYMTFHNDRGNFRRTLSYLKKYTGIDFFKQMKTVWSTKYYVNNVFNAMPMVELSGGSVLDAPGAIIDIANNAPIVQRLIDENFLQQGVLTKQLAAEAKSILERDLKKAGITTQRSIASALQESALNLGKTKETLQLVSQATDDMWRLTVYQGLRRRQGLSHEEAKEIALGAVYDSRSVTSPAAAVAEVIAPFAKVTAWMMDKTAELSIANPHKLAYLLGVGSLIPYALASMQASQERLAAEEEVIDDWLKGTKLFGTNMSLGIGFPEKIRVWSSGNKAFYWDTKNFGGLQGLAADTGTSGFGFLPTSLQPGGPWWAIVQAVMNWNEFKKEKIRARDTMQRDITIDDSFISSPAAEFMIKALAPTGIPDSISLGRSMLGLPEASGRVISTWTKLLALMGVKIREVDLDTQVEKSISKGEAALNQWRKEREKDFKIYERMIEPGSNVSQTQIDNQLDRLRRWDEKIEKLSEQELERQMKVTEGAFK